MQFSEVNTVSCDVLIVGGGGASLRAAIEAKEMGADVVVVSKSKVGYGNNTIISAGIFAASGLGDPEDKYGVHLKDTVAGGCFLNDQKLVAVAVREVQAQVDFLERCGVQFVKKEGKLKLSYTPGHTFKRHVNVTKGGGKGLILPLRAYAEKAGIRFFNQVFVTKLLINADTIQGATGITADGSFFVFKAKCLILATGGFGQVYKMTNNAAGITGDGHLLAFEAGVPFKDMEFVQFYPTNLGKNGKKIVLYEFIVGKLGGILRNVRGENILDKHGMNEPRAMTRDKVARAIMHEITAGLDVEGGVMLDLSSILSKSRLKALLPVSWTEDQQEIIVTPTTHFCMGGIVVNDKMETYIPGLFGAGEICAGVHGANRLGGNALAEVFALGSVAGRNAAVLAKELEQPEVSKKSWSIEQARLTLLAGKKGCSQKRVREALKELMWYKAGIVRNQKNLMEALERIEELKEMSSRVPAQAPTQLMKYLELSNMLAISEIVCRAALLRTESRGAHYRIDYPKEDNSNWLKNIIVRKSDQKVDLEAVPVSMEFIQLP